MSNFMKICKPVLIAAFFCVFVFHSTAKADSAVDINYGHGRSSAALEQEAENRPVVDGKPVPKVTNNTNPKASAGQVSGCTKDLGLFSGLISTGNKVFTGLRDLIYVVAGFGIIGVAVGGFFGNLNWKWLGAIIIGLVVIATTGELINAITGCTEYTSAMIQDTLK